MKNPLKRIFENYAPNRLLKQALFAVILLMAGNYAGAQDIQSIKSVFSDFNAGYAKRDTSQKDNFCNKLFAPDITIVGTGADEWIAGISAAKTLIKNDWAYWLNLSVDTSSIQWRKQGSVILFLAKASPSISFADKELAYDFGVSQLDRAVKAQPNNRLKLLAYASESTHLINEIEQSGLNVKYAIRITGAMVQQGGHLVFKQLVYSFPFPLKRE